MIIKSSKLPQLDTITAGKVELIRTSGGDLRFLDVNGNMTTIPGDPRTEKLWHAMKKGSGKAVTITRVEGTEPPTNFVEKSRMPDSF